MAEGHPGKLIVRPIPISSEAISRAVARKFGCVIEPLVLSSKTTPIEVGTIPKFTLFDNSLLVDTAPRHIRSQVRALLDQYKAYIDEIVQENSRVFEVQQVVRLSNGIVGICKPIDMNYAVIPIYVHVRGETCLVFAYRSRSQESWRRFAGFCNGIYWKGSSEHMQNLDWKIQKAIDQCFSLSKPIALFHKGRCLDLPDLSIADDGDISSFIIKTGESLTQTFMSVVEPIDFNSPKKRPNTLIDFWWSGEEVNSAYGTHLNLVVASDTHIFCIAATGDGMFLKYLQPRLQDINRTGSSVRGVNVPSNMAWVFTPCLDYAGYIIRVAEVRSESNIDIQDTVFSDEANGHRRKRITGLHDTPASPLFNLNAGIWPLYRLIRQEKYDQIDSFLRTMSSDLPLANSIPSQPEPHQDLVSSKYRMLAKAFRLFYGGQSDATTVLRVMRVYALSAREVSVLVRYSRYLHNNADPELFDLARQRVVEKLSWIAEMWASDQIPDS